MMYILTRIILIALLVLVLFMIFKKKIVMLSKYKRIIFFATPFIIFFISMYIPFESEIVTFDNPIEAFQYSYISNNIVDIIVEDECAFILYRSGDSSLNFTYVNKIDNKWQVKVPISLFSEVKFTNHKSDIIVRVTNKKCGKKLILVMTMLSDNNPTDIVISDNQNSLYKPLVYEDVKSSTKSYYAVIDSNTQNYQIIINGEEIEIN